jgi:hypothetical protein
MICPRCGVSNNESDQYCQSCGRSLAQTEPTTIEESPTESMQSEPEPQPQNWSKMALGSLALITIAWLLVRNLFVEDFFGIALRPLALIATGLSIGCARAALAEIEYIQRNKANFWIVVVSMALAYILILFFVTMLFGFLHTLANWE